MKKRHRLEIIITKEYKDRIKTAAKKEGMLTAKWIKYLIYKYGGIKR